MADLTTSIIVPTFNRRSRLERLLLRLDELHAKGRDFEVLVADDGSTDGTAAMLSTLHVTYPLRLLPAEHAGPCAARNRAMQASSGELLLFLDDDVWPCTGLIESHLELHRRDQWAAAIGPMVPPRNLRLAPWLRWEAAMLQRQYELFASDYAAPTQLHFYTGNASVRRAHALAAGGFDERFTRQEDVEFAYRLGAHGLRFYFLPDAKAEHMPDRTLAGWLHMAYQYGRAAVLMQRKGHPYGRAVAYLETHSRHPLNRLPPHWCVGHPARSRVVMTAFRAALRYRGPAQDRLHRAACSVVYNVQYWQGFADETGLGTKLWDELATQWRALAQSA
jgi:GT2 family glycosyltransferase